MEQPGNAPSIPKGVKRSGSGLGIVAIVVAVLALVFGVIAIVVAAVRDGGGGTSIISESRVSTEGSDLSKFYDEANESVVYLYNSASQFVVDPTTGYLNIEESASLGSGFVYDADGYIVTNAHVVANDFGTQIHPSIEVVFPATGKTYVARVIAADAINDIAIVKIEARNLKPLKWGKIEEVHVGDQVFAVGSPGGANDIVSNLKNTMTSGIVSGLNRSFGVIPLALAIQLAGQLPGTIPSLAHNDLIQMDVAINHGNSGGPLFNAKGEVIGVNTLGETSEGQQGLNFAVPVNVVQRVADDAKQHGKLTSPYHGAIATTVDALTARLYGFSVSKGALVYIVIPESPAASSGLLPGDIITSVNGTAISTSQEFESIVRGLKAGDTVNIQYDRFGASNSASVVTVETPSIGQ